MRSDGLVGYDDRLTRGRRPVRSRVGVFYQFLMDNAPNALSGNVIRKRANGLVA